MGNLNQLFSGPSNIAGSGSCQSHECLVETTLLPGLLIKPSRTFIEVLSKIHSGGQYE